MRIALSILSSLLSLNLAFVAASNPDPDDDNDTLKLNISAKKPCKEPLDLYGKKITHTPPAASAITNTELESKAAFWDTPKKRSYKSSVNGQPLVHRFKIGPIMDDLTTSSVRIWGMAPQADFEGKKLMGVLRYREVGSGRDFSPPIYFPLLPQNQYAGICHLTDLKAGAKYKFQMGWVQMPKDMAENPKELEWGYKSTGRKRNKGAIPQVGRSLRGGVQTVSQEKKPTRFVFSSCNYQNPKDPTDALKEEGFEGIVKRRGRETMGLLQQFLRSNGIDQLDGVLQLGDFVYVDYMNILNGARTRQEIYALYQDIMTRPELHVVLKHTPLIATLDDHELENDFNGDSLKHPSERAKNALEGFKIFQTMRTNNYNPEGNQFSKFWRTTNIGRIPLFMLDLRTERFPSQNQLLNKAQLDALKEFLLANKEKSVQFVGSSVPLAPDFNPKLLPDTYADKWSGYPETRNELLDFCHKHKIHNVVFLNGDVHFSAFAEITKKDTSFRMLSLTSSPWYWPIYFEPDRFMDSHDMDGYHSTLLSPQVATNNFTYCEVNAEETQMKVQIVGEKDRNILKRLWHRITGGYVPKAEVLFEKTFALTAPAKKDEPLSKGEPLSDKVDGSA